MFLVVASAVTGAGRIFLRTGNAKASLVVGAVLAVGLGLWIVMPRVNANRRFEEGGYADVALDGMLEYACLPEPWPDLARETMGGAADRRELMMPVTVAVTGGALVVQRRKVALSGDAPFSLRVDLRDVRNVEAGPPLVPTHGSSLVLDLASGQHLRLDLAADGAAARLAGEVNAGRSSGWDPSRPAGGIEITSPPPKVGTPLAPAAYLVGATMIPFGAAMIAVRGGPFAAVTTAVTLVLALVLSVRRPATMPALLASAIAFGGLGFAIDASRTAQPARLLGTLLCLTMSVGMLFVPTGEAAPVSAAPERAPTDSVTR